MTNKRKLISLLGFMPANGDTIDGALIDVGLTGSADYVVANERTLKKALLTVLEILFSTPNTTTSTGGVVSSSMTYDRNALEKKIRALKVELGIRDENVIYNATHKW